LVILKTGALAVPLNFRFTADEIKKCLETAGAKVLIFGPEFEERVKDIVDEIHGLQHAFFPWGGDLNSSPAYPISSI